MSKKTNKSITEMPEYLPTPEEQAVIEKALARKAARAPRLKIEKNVITTDHPYEDLGLVLVGNSIGSSDPIFTNGLLLQLARAAQQQGKVEEADLNCLVSLIQDVKPRDQVESALAAQMAAIHRHTMRFAAQLCGIQNVPQQDSAVRAFVQLARTFAAQIEALRRYRNGGEQKIIVERLSVSEGGQAIVGNVTHAPREANHQSSSPTSRSRSQAAEMEPVEIQPLRSNGQANEPR